MAEHGEEKLIEVARHIAKTLGRTDTMANDILRIFSDFDGRFTRERLAANHHPGSSISDEQTTPIAFSSINRQISLFLSSDRSIWSDASDAAVFLDAVDALIASVRGHNSSPAVNRADDLLQQCMLRLEDEFRSMIEHPFDVSPFDPVPPPELDSDGEDDPIPVAPPVTDYDFFIDVLPPGTLADVHEIAKRMVAAGFGRECAHAYSLSRRDFLEESFCRLGIRIRTADKVGPAPWTELENDIIRWVKGMNVAFRILFPSERRLCLRIFSGSSAIADLSFAEACRGPAIQLLRFADAIASAKRSPEKLFRMIDMYEAFREIVPEVDALFSDQYSESLHTEVFTVWKKLGSAIRGIFTEFDNLIRRDPATATEAVPGGGLHPITRYVMNYLRAACDSWRTLEEVMDEDGFCAAADRRPEQKSSPFAAQIAWIMEVLQGNLKAKATMYREPALSCIFLMNNCRYMMQKVSSSSELLMLLGEDWIRRQAAMERQWAAKYLKSSWGKVTAVLRINGGDFPTAEVMRERLRMVDVYLEETRRAQMDWVVADDRLKKELRVAAAGIILPAYWRFLEVYRGLSEERRHGEKILRHYSPREVEMKINELFGGSRRP
ncbi:hypothetical protein M5K25_015192 [Dendrobium thyrsiflorum]|uniref:Exocyst subunit Exo70 family protein n=1 Tax=Dendrobium thyrsiflorum TaxID=117978 RepID=A0ABD0UPL4_DENTH